MRSEDIIRIIFSPWILLGAVLIGGFLFAGALLSIWMVAPEPSASVPATAVLTVIYAPTATLPVPTGTPTLIPSPTSPIPAAPAAGVIGTGGYVQISGTGGDGLRLRVEPGLQTQVRFIGIEAEVFQVIEGPVETDGYTWWLLGAPYDETRRGWAVSNYLLPIQSP